MKHQHQAAERAVSSDAETDSASSRVVRPRRTSAGRLKGVKPVERGRRMTGSIVRLWYGQGHGFVRADDGREMFFHYRDVATGLFNALATRDRVVFEVVEDAIAGPRAVKVRRMTRSRRDGR